jgi:hypothetical protein
LLFASFEFSCNARVSPHKPDDAIKFVEEWEAQTFGLLLVPLDCVIYFLVRQTEEANIHR